MDLSQGMISTRSLLPTLNDDCRSRGGSLQKTAAAVIKSFTNVMSNSLVAAAPAAAERARSGSSQIYGRRLVAEQADRKHTAACAECLFT
jgi:hypothetical protein